MAAWNSSSLGFSDSGGLKRHFSGLMKNLPTRISKQHLTEHKMFGAKRKNIQIGKSFKKVGKGIFKGSSAAKMEPSMKGKGISPSIPEFDKMMNSISKGSTYNGNKKKSLFSRKSFG
jgi:hypothetical protein